MFGNKIDYKEPCLSHDRISHPDYPGLPKNKHLRPVCARIHVGGGPGVARNSTAERLRHSLNLVLLCIMFGLMHSYCGWKKSCTSSWWFILVYPIIYRVSTIQGGAGFLPPTAELMAGTSTDQSGAHLEAGCPAGGWEFMV